MFDDNPPSGAGQVPNNLPMGEPEDILSGVESDTPAAVVPPQPLPDVIPEMDDNTALGAGVLKAKQPEPMSTSEPMSEPMMNQPIPEMPQPRQPMMDSQPMMNTMPQSERMTVGQPSMPPMPPQNSGMAPVESSAYQNMPQAGQPQMTVPPYNMHNGQNNDVMANMGQPIGSKKAIIWIIIIVVIAVLGSGSAWIYFSFIKTSNNANFDNVAAPTDFEDNSDVATTPLPDNNTNTTTDTNGDTVFDLDQEILVGSEPLDTDADGLDDVREAGLGTDPLNWDSDGDELSDSDEVIIWKTDPLNSDTDGDSYPDGLEIKNGYSPTGPGKLFEPPRASSTEENIVTSTSSTASTSTETP